ncbi:DUF222 domain-containing protein [Microbacterium sp.]|uniref:DUF222 domain-containing protein n=1 Tax=Microbacterium sp. TaxID=51671 RepID=UPI0039C962B6
MDSTEARSAEWRAVWSLAAEQLMAEAPRCTPEELLRGARQVRDRLDPDGAADRFARRYEARSFRMWADDHGQHRAHLVLDDEGAAWLRAMVDAFMRPRRGGPRFVDSDERESARRTAARPCPVRSSIERSAHRAGGLSPSTRSGIRCVSVARVGSSARSSGSPSRCATADACSPNARCPRRTARHTTSTISSRMRVGPTELEIATALVVGSAAPDSSP